MSSLPFTAAARGRGSLFVSHPRLRAMSATNAQDLKRFGKNTKDNLDSVSLSFDAVQPLKNLREHSQAASRYCERPRGGIKNASRT